MVLATYKNVGNINAETVVSRNRSLKLLHTVLSDITDSVYDWTIPVASRTELIWSLGSSRGHYAPCRYPPLRIRQLGGDAKGPEAWPRRKVLPRGGEEGKDASSKAIPNTINAIHLVRRGDLLLGILREHDNMKKKVNTTSPAPVASSPRGTKWRAESEIGHSVKEGGPRKKKRRATPTFTDSESSDKWYAPFRMLLVPALSSS